MQTMAETIAIPAPVSSAAGERTQAKAGSEKEVVRQTIGFSFFKVMPEWRRLPKEERTTHKQAFAVVDLLDGGFAA
jgi:hypothetical protein